MYIYTHTHAYIDIHTHTHMQYFARNTASTSSSVSAHARDLNNVRCT